MLCSFRLISGDKLRGWKRGKRKTEIGGRQSARHRPGPTQRSQQHTATPTPPRRTELHPHALERERERESDSSPAADGSKKTTDRFLYSLVTKTEVTRSKQQSKQPHPNPSRRLPLLPDYSGVPVPWRCTLPPALLYGIWAPVIRLRRTLRFPPLR